MKTLAEVREQYPQYADLSDEQLAQGLHRKYYSDIPYNEFAGKLGLAASKGPPRRYVKDKTASMGGGELAGQGALKFLRDLATGFEQRWVSGEVAQGKPGAAEAEAFIGTRASVDRSKDRRLMEKPAAQVGYLGGALGATVPTMFLPGANTVAGSAAIGGVMGLMQPTVEGESAVENAGKGALWGAAGQGAANVVGKVAAPVKRALTPAQSRSIATLEAADVPLDAAQRTGSARLGMAKASLADNPITVSGQRTAAEAQKKAFNRAVLKNVGAAADVADEQVMGGTYARVGRVFEDVLGKYEIRPSSKSLSNLAALERSAKRQGAGEAITAIANDIREELAANGGRLTGRFYQNMRRDIAALEIKPEYAPIARQLREGFDDAFQQTASKADAEALKLARREWRNMRIIENAIDSEGNISPAKLANQFGQKKNRYAGVYGGGDESIVRLARLAKAGKNVIPEKLPNSGSAPRALMQIAAPAVIGGGYGAYQEGDLAGIGMYAAGGAALPFLAQKAINSPGVANYLAHGISQPFVRNALLAPSRVGVGASVPAYLLSQQ
jgi:hypothetical protein